MIYNNDLDIESIHFNDISRRFSYEGYLDAARFLLYANYEGNVDKVLELANQWKSLKGIEEESDYYYTGFDYMVSDLGEEFVNWALKNDKTVEEWYMKPMSESTNMTWDDAVSTLYAYMSGSDRCELYNSNFAWNVKMYNLDIDTSKSDSEFELSMACTRAIEEFGEEVTDFPGGDKYSVEVEGRSGGHLVLYAGEYPVGVPGDCQFFKDSPDVAAYLAAIHNMENLDEIAIALDNGKEALHTRSCQQRVKDMYEDLMNELSIENK